MSSTTTMIIIMTNEDILQRLQSNGTSNVQMIDLDNKTHRNQNVMPSTSNNVDVDNDILSSSEQNRSKSKKTAKCVVCSTGAVGFSYDVWSCGSCKVFFHRNAYQDLNKLRCLTGKDQCSVSHEVRRKCLKCRLKRCFAMGMRKDFVSTEEEKQRKKKCLEENRKLTLNPVSTSESVSSIENDINQLLMDIEQVNNEDLSEESSHRNHSIECLSVEDHMIIDYIKSLMSISFQKEMVKYSSLDVSDLSSAIITWSYIANQRVLCFVKFFGQIEEFKNLDENDRFVLFKSNLIFLFPIFISFFYDRQNQCYVNDNTEETIKCYEFYKFCFQTTGLNQLFMNSVIGLVEITDQDQIILSLLMIIVLFSQNLSMNEGPSFLKDPFAVYQAQSSYLNILWKYLVDKQGELESYKQFIEILRVIFRIQALSKRIFEYFHSHPTVSNVTDKIAPLMQSILHIS